MGMQAAAHTESASIKERSQHKKQNKAEEVTIGDERKKNERAYDLIRQTMQIPST